MTAVLDWEMATLGDPPRRPLGLSLTYWSLPEAQKVAGMETCGGVVDARAGGIPRGTPSEPGSTAPRACTGTKSWGTFKLAVILQQIYARYAQVQTHDERFGRAWDAWPKRSHFAPAR